MEQLFGDSARWIWPGGNVREKNAYVCFRRRFAADGETSAAILRITADTRYELWVNGESVGFGPARSWPSCWGVDEYDIRHLLTPGANVIAVLVHHVGLSTFQYIHAEAGLLAELSLNDARGSRAIATDGSWRCCAHEGYGWPAPRISCQQGWEEQLDARVSPGAPEEWTAPGYDDSSWPGAAEARKLGEGTHREFELRDIPPLTRTPVEPAAIRTIEAVRPAPYTFTLNPRELLNATDKSANHLRGRLLLATYIHSEKPQAIELHSPHDRPAVAWTLNGKPLKFDDRSLQRTGVGVAHAKLRAGENILMGRLPETEHFWWAVINLWTNRPIAFAEWLAIGPFPNDKPHVFDRTVVDAESLDPAATLDQYESIWKTGAFDRDASFVRRLPRDMVSTVDVYAQCASERVVDERPRVDAPDALRNDGPDWTTIHPLTGADPRILLDFDRETIGFHEFEIDAPAGTVVDFHNFEFIQRDGRINLTEGMNNSFRYTCREGVQRYRTFLRRGFRYSWMTLRGFSRPVRIRFVRVIQSTYPIGPAGSFECSDQLLNRIWEVGVHSVRCCAEDTYTDCPTYEQTFWVGDARNEAMVHLVADGDPRLSARCLKLTGRSLERSEIVESQVPSGWQNLLTTWCFLWMRWAAEHWDLTGDASAARDLLPMIDGNMRGFEKHINADGLIQMYAWNMFDWAGMETPAGGVVTHLNCLAVLALRQCAAMAKQLRRADLVRRWTGLADKLSAAINRRLWSRKSNAYLDCIRADGADSPVFSQQTQTAAFISGVATGARARRCLSIIDNPPPCFIRAGSPFFMFFLLEALVREKRFDSLVDTIRSYWGQQIDAGATTFWEMFHPGAERLTRSHCHGWSAAPVVFLTQHILGVRPLSPGYAKTLIAPQPGDLAWAQGRVPTPLGPINCYWSNRGGIMELRVDAPKKMELQIELPKRGKVDVMRGKLSRTGVARGSIHLRVHGRRSSSTRTKP